MRPDREPLAEPVEADETYVGGPRPGKGGRGAADKIKVVGAVESARGQAKAGDAPAGDQLGLGRARESAAGDAPAGDQLGLGDARQVPADRRP